MNKDDSIRIYDKLEQLNKDMNEGFRLLSTQIADTVTRVTVVESELKNKVSEPDFKDCQIKHLQRKKSTPPAPFKSNTDRQPWVNILLLILKGAILIIAGGGASAAIFN